MPNIPQDDFDRLVDMGYLDPSDAEVEAPPAVTSTPPSATDSEFKSRADIAQAITAADSSGDRAKAAELTAQWFDFGRQTQAVAPTPPPSIPELAEQIAKLESEGNWRAAMPLKAQWASQLKPEGTQA